MLDFNQKYWKWLIVVLCAAYCLIEVDGKGDFYIFISAANNLGNGFDIYSKSYVDGYHYYYSVLFAIILKPLSTLPFLAVKFCWLFLNSILFFNLLQMLYKTKFIQTLSKNQQTIFLLLAFVVSLRFFTDNIHLSQISILILWCCIKGVFLISNNKPISGALILAIGINLKLLPLVFIPYLLYRGYFKACFLTIFFYLLFLMAPSLIIGHQYNMFLLAAWKQLINPTNQQHILDVDERSFHGLSTLLSTLFVKNVPDPLALKIPRNIANVSIETLSKIILLVRLTLIAFTLYFLRLKFFTKAKTSFSQCIEVSYILLLIPLIFPHQQHYAFIFTIPAYSIVLYFLILNWHTLKYKNIITVLMVLIYLVFNLKLLLGEFNHYYEHFKILTYFALLLIPLLIYVYKKSTKDLPIQI